MTLLLYVSVHRPGLPVVVLVDDLTDELAQQAQWFGALGTLSRSSDPYGLPQGLDAMLGLRPRFAASPVPLMEDPPAPTVEPSSGVAADLGVAPAPAAPAIADAPVLADAMVPASASKLPTPTRAIAYGGPSRAEPHLSTRPYVASGLPPRRAAMPQPAKRLMLVPNSPRRIDTDLALSGIFQGLGPVRGHRATLALDADGALLSARVDDQTLDTHEAATALHHLIAAGHAACETVGLAQCQLAVMRAGPDTFVMSCCKETGHHVHFVTILEESGNQPLVELAHRRLRRELLSGDGFAA